MSILLHKNDYVVSYRSTEVISISVSYAGKVTLVYKCGKYEVWQKAAGKCWGGIGLPPDHIPAWTVLVSSEPCPPLVFDRLCGKDVDMSGRFYVKEIEGKETASKKYLAKLIEQCDALAREETFVDW